MIIKCGFCGYAEGIDLLTRTLICGDLPFDTYQCPKCGKAFRRVAGKPRVYPSGFIAPGRIKLEPVEARL